MLTRAHLNAGLQSPFDQKTVASPVTAGFPATNVDPDREDILIKQGTIGSVEEDCCSCIYAID